MSPELVWPRASLEACLLQAMVQCAALRPSPTGTEASLHTGRLPPAPATPASWWSTTLPLALSPMGQCLRALVQAGAPAAGHPSQRPSLHLIAVAAGATAPAAQFDPLWWAAQSHHPKAWLSQLGQEVAVLLWLSADGRARAYWRWPAPQPGEPARWQALRRVSLPGAPGLLMHLDGPQAEVRHGPPPQLDDTEASFQAQPEPGEPAGRFSRQALALQPRVLRRLQASRVGIVGLGRLGSVLAHILVRLGVAHLLLIDDDVMEPHNLDGDLPPLQEGRPKVAVARRFLTPLLRPGASLDARQLSISSPIAGALTAGLDLLVVAADNPHAQWWANAWAKALHLNLLVLNTGLLPPSPLSAWPQAEAELRLLPAGTACLACWGGVAQAQALVEQLQRGQRPPTPANVALQRPGSLRSWAGLTAHLGLRLIEQWASGQQSQALFRRVWEDESGLLRCHDHRPHQALSCPVCAGLSGVGVQGVSPQVLATLAKTMVSPSGWRDIDPLTSSQVKRG